MNSVKVMEMGDAGQVALYRHPDEFPPAVQYLFDLAESDSIEFGSTWYRNLVETVYRQHDGVFFFVAWVAGHPVAALPLVVTKGRWGNKGQALANFYSALYAPALAPTAKPEDLATLVKSIRATCGPLTSLHFAPMDPQARGYRYLQAALRDAGMFPFTFFRFGNWYMPVDKPWDAYLATREGVLRSTLKRMGKKFANDGGRLEIVSGGSALETSMKAYELVYSKSWKVPEPFPDFMPGLIRSSSAQSWLRLGVAWLGDQPVAAQVWFVANKKAYIYKLAYDEAFKAYAPGTLLTAMLLKHVMEQDKVVEVDYLIGDDSYKRTWVGERRERWGIVAYDSRTLSGLLGLGWELLGRLRRRLSGRQSAPIG